LFDCYIVTLLHCYIVTLLYMSDNFIRHLVAFIGTLIVLLAFWAGYQAGQAGWWWSVLTVIVVYLGIYRLLDVGSHH